MRYLIILCALLLVEVVAYCQTTKVEYAYDAAGNRTSRQIVTISAKSTFLHDTIALAEGTMGGLNFKIFPNPTHGVLTMDISNLNNDQKVNYFVTDMKGRTMIKREVKYSTTFKIDLSEFPAGIYILSAIIGEQRKEWKIIKE
jgi:hypothetical protein